MKENSSQTRKPHTRHNKYPNTWCLGIEKRITMSIENTWIRLRPPHCANNTIVLINKRIVKSDRKNPTQDATNNKTLKHGVEA